MLAAVATPRNRFRTCALLALCGAFAAAAGAVGISDHPPGIALCYLASVAAVLALAHPWRAAKPFLWLLLGAVAGFVVTAFVHNVTEVGGGRVGGVAGAVLGAIGGAAFLAAVLLCPAAVVVGGIGALVSAVRNRRRAPGACRGAG